jgi:3-aminobutyryl-CoA ammonia-lyase
VTAAEAGFTVTHRRYVTHGDAHYGGGLVDGAYVLSLFGDVATEACVLLDGDEGLLASYSDVQFRAPVQAGDMIEATCVVTRVGTRSREMSFEARVTCRADPGRGPSAAAALAEPLVVVTATGTVVVPAKLRRRATTSARVDTSARGEGMWSLRREASARRSERQRASTGAVLGRGPAREPGGPEERGCPHGAARRYGEYRCRGWGSKGGEAPLGGSAWGLVCIPQ